ncbi:MAG: sulfatase-like hydrolase/transferase [Verrucomicrobiaceae bacterium]|nr:sulfatase-like hydrolase/transferase [Verrucomicrobiaceae bacterium]
MRISLRYLLPLLFVGSQSFAVGPNFVLMMGDDHGWEETGYHGHPHVKTPVLDEMAATGLKLERFHSAHPSCSPTRASFLTGRHPNRMGTFDPGYSFRPEEITIAHLMSKAGYQCGHFGKWHVGAVKKESPVSPGAMGFHEWLSHDNFFELNPSLSRNGGPPEVHQGESSAILVDETIRFIADATAKGKSFMTVVWFGSPHEPYSGLPEDLALYDDLPAKYNDKKVRLTSNETGGPVTRPQGDVLRERYAEITAMDRAIGRLRRYLKEKNLAENTLVFYCGDNGTSGDAVRHSPHRGAKGQVYDGGTLVPGIIEWPAKIKKPQTSNITACTSDLLPTLCALTATALPDRPLDGIDLSPVLGGSLEQRPGIFAVWSFNAGRFGKTKPAPWIEPSLQEGTTPLAKRSGGKATRDFRNFKHPGLSEDDYTGARAIEHEGFKLVIHDSGKTSSKKELFDLKKDPAEKNDISQQEAERSQSLANKLRDWQTSVLNSLTGADYTDKK